MFSDNLCDSTVTFRVELKVIILSKWWFDVLRLIVQSSGDGIGFNTVTLNKSDSSFEG